MQILFPERWINPRKEMNRWYESRRVTRSLHRLCIDSSQPMAATRYEKIYDAVRRIPRGKVATYGQIARIVDRCTARMVGYAMAALRGRNDVPWQRVINAKGEISTRSRGDGALRQRKLLEKEGIRFDPRGRVNLRRARWKDS